MKPSERIGEISAKLFYREKKSAEDLTEGQTALIISQAVVKYLDEQHEKESK